jgi:AraC family transcriptional regulator, arabinose operon regulatory protein
MSGELSADQARLARGVDALTRPAWLLASSETRVRLTSPPTYWRCEPGWSWQARPLPDYLLWYVFDGIGQLSLGEQHYELTPGTSVVFAPRDEPVARHDPRRRLLVFGMHFAVPAVDGADPAPSEVVPPSRWCQMRDQALVTSLARHCDMSYRRGGPLAVLQSQLCLEQLLCLLWEDFVHPPPGPVDAALHEITHAIRQDPSRRWTLAELAERAALSRAQFTRRFTAHAGMSPMRYVIKARIDRAHHLLTETKASVTQVAVTLGYTDVGYFSRQYKRHTGRPPSRAR